MISYTETSDECMQLPEEKATTSIYQLHLFPPADDLGCLPPRLKGKIPHLTKDELAQQTAAWQEGPTAPPSASKSNPSRMKPYDINICASPRCDRLLASSEKEGDHLSLCSQHRKELITYIQNFLQSYKIYIPTQESVDEVHKMVYQNVLPSINRLIRRLNDSTGDHDRYVLRLIYTYKACIYLYRMHLNQMREVIQMIIALFNWLLDASTEAMRTFVERILQAITYVFGLCGILLILPLRLLLCRERNLAIAAGVGGVGLCAYGILTLVGVVAAAPVAIVTAGGILIGLAISSSIPDRERQRQSNWIVAARLDLVDAQRLLRQMMAWPTAQQAAQEPPEVV